MSRRFMRLIVFFDLPVVKKRDRQEYQKFRRFLINDGYNMIQFSVYSRICNGIDGVNKHIARLNNNLPPRGSVRFLQVTEKQYSEMKFLVGSQKPQEKIIKATQLSIF
ncbi:CRISPR-associated endonuclease Cas2 [Clostridium colicanis]|jgi:CRISPR-associated protein Cas2|nr:CRISPR-associated endonuclease Cas2 [Clostridium colicanis]